VRVPAAVDPAERNNRDANRDVAAVGRGGLANLVGAVVSAVVNFGLVLVIARWDDPYEAGVFFGVTSLFLVLETVLRLGSDVGAVYFLARWRALREHARIRHGVRVALVPVAIASAVVTAVLLVVAPQLDGLIGDERHTAIGLLRLLAVILPIAATYDVAIGATRGLGAMRPTVLIEKIARPLLQFALVVVVLAVGWHGALGAAWGLPYVAAALAGWWSLRRLVRAAAPAATRAAERARSTFREYWRFTLPRAVAGAAQIILQRLDIVLVAAMRGAAEAAIYTAATRFLVVGQFVSQAIAAPVQPRLSAALAEHDSARAGALYRVSTCWIVLISWPLFATVGVFAPVYLRLFGHHYKTGLTVVVILAASMLVATAVGVVDAVVIMAGRTSWNLGTTLAAMIINVLLDVLLIPHLGIVGAAIGWCAAIVASNVVPLLLAWRGLGLHPFGRSTLAACALAGVCFVALPAIGRAISLPAAGIGLAAGTVLFLLAAYRWRAEFELTALAQLRRRPRAAVSQ
jgi:O-antigen/teichoic acid export membrane protein